MTNDWETICKQCGQCCFEKIIEEDGTVYATPIPCRYLDITSRTCKVYHKRFKVGVECVRLTPRVVRNAFWLPRDCAYVRHLEDAEGRPDDSGSTGAEEDE